MLQRILQSLLQESIFQDCLLSFIQEDLNLNMTYQQYNHFLFHLLVSQDHLSYSFILIRILINCFFQELAFLKNIITCNCYPHHQTTYFLQSFNLHILQLYQASLKLSLIQISFYYFQLIKFTVHYFIYCQTSLKINLPSLMLLTNQIFF